MIKPAQAAVLQIADDEAAVMLAFYNIPVMKGNRWNEPITVAIAMLFVDPLDQCPLSKMNGRSPHIINRQQAVKQRDSTAGFASPNAHNDMAITWLVKITGSKIWMMFHDIHLLENGLMACVP